MTFGFDLFLGVSLLMFINNKIDSKKLSCNFHLASFYLVNSFFRVCEPEFSYIIDFRYLNHQHSTFRYLNYQSSTFRYLSHQLLDI